MPPTLSSARPIVNDLHDASAWPIHYLSRALIQAREQYYTRMLRFELTTAFSGICAPSVSASMLGAAISNFQQERIMLEYKNAVEIDNHCRLELEMCPHRPEHIFGDILAFATHDTHLILRDRTELSLDLLEEIFLKRDSVRLRATCHFHSCKGVSKCDCGFDCFCELVPGFLHVAGIPCTDWTPQGQKAGAWGETMVCLFCWIALRRRLLTPVLVLENVPQFPFSMLQRFLPMYKLDDAIIDNEVTLGLSISRTRRYCIAILVLYYHLERPLSQLDSCLGRSRGGSHSWRDYFVADTAELQAELSWSRKRKSSRAHGATVGTDRSISATSFEDSLCPWEYKHLQGARQLGRGHLYLLSQDPGRKQRSSGNVAAALIANMHMLYSDHHNRWSTSRECLAMQGWPVFDVMLHALFGEHRAFDLCSFNRTRARFCLPGRLRSAVVQQSGNAMHTAAIGAVLLWLFCFVVEKSSVNTGTAIPAPLSAPRTPLTPLCDVASAEVSNLTRHGDVFDDSLRRLSIAANASKKAKQERARNSFLLSSALPLRDVFNQILNSPASSASVATSAVIVTSSPSTSPGTSPGMSRLSEHAYFSPFSVRGARASRRRTSSVASCASAASSEAEACAFSESGSLCDLGALSPRPLTPNPGTFDAMLNAIRGRKRKRSASE